MLLSPSGEKNLSSDGKSPIRAASGPSKLLVGVSPVNDENLQNYKIQVAVNRYNSSNLPPFRQFPMSAYKCSFIRSKSPLPKHSTEFRMNEREENPQTMQGVSYQPRSRQFRTENTFKADGYPSEPSPQFSRLGPYRQRVMKRPSNHTMLKKGEGSSVLSERLPTSPELRYTGPEHFPTCHIYKSPCRQMKKHNILSQLNAHSAGLPVSRFLDDSAEKYSDLKSTRSVLDVLQDMSRKRMHGKEDGDDATKRRCKGLGGDLVQEGEVAYKPLFVPKGRTSLWPRKDQTTQTDKSSKQQSPDASPSLDDPKSELRKVLARKNNEIAASLSSSARGFVFTKRKRAAQTESNDVSCSGENVVAKKKRFSDASRTSPNTTLDTPILRREKSSRTEASPKSPSNKDRLMSIYFDLQNESDAKLNAIKAISTSPGQTQFVRPEGSSDQAYAVTPKAVESPAVAFAGSKQTSMIDATKPNLGSPNFNFGTPTASKPEATTALTSVDLNAGIIAPKTTATTQNFNFGTPKSTQLGMPPVTATISSPIAGALQKENSLQLSFGSSSGLSPTTAFPIKADPVVSTPAVTPATEATATVADSFTPLVTNFSASPVASVTCTTTSVYTPITTSATQEGKDKAPLQNTGAFNLTSTSPASTGGFSFQSTPVAAATPTFSFGKSTATPPKSTAFTFEKTQPTAASPVQASVTPTFSIGRLAATPAPIATFGKTTTTVAPPSPFSFGLAKPTDSKSAQHSFGASPEGSTDPRLESSFNVSKANATIAPTSFLVNAPKSEASTTAPTTQMSTSNPTFSFGKTPISSPTFMFGDKPVASSLPTNALQVDSGKTLLTDKDKVQKTNGDGSSAVKWSFGASATSSESTSVFGSPAATTVPKAVSTADSKPSSVFARLGAPVASKPFLFGAPNSEASSMPSTTTGSVASPFTGFGLPTTASQPQNTSVASSTTQGNSTVQGFAFGQPQAQTVTSDATPAFRFGQNLAKSTSGFTAGASSGNIFPAFGASAPATTSAATPAVGTGENIFGQAHSFGTTTPAPTTIATTSFGLASTPFSIGTTTSSSGLPGFPQSQTTASSLSLPQATSAPVFGQATTGGSTITSGSKFGQTAPLFGSGTAALGQTPPIAFGSNPSTTSAFNFGKTDAITTAPTFGQAAAVFSFGSAGQSSPFGTPVTTAPAPTTQTGTFGAVSAFGSLATPQQSFGGGFGQPSAVFGQTTAPAFGQSTPSTTSATSGTFTFGKNAGAGSTPFSFGKATTAQTPMFGTGNSVSTSAFGGGQTGNTLAFGSATTEKTTTFGTVATGTAPAFGASTTGTTPSFGAGATPAFGTASTGSAPAFGAGATGTAPAFGTVSSGSTLAFGAGATGTAAAGTTPSLFGSSAAPPAFGSTPVTTTSPSGGSLFTFGAGQPNKPASSVFNFGSPASAPSPAQPSPFAFGSSSQPSSGFHFSAPAAGNNFSFGGSGSAPSVGFGQTGTPSFGSTPAPSPGGFSPFGQAPATGVFVPGTFSIGSGSSQSRSRAPVRARRR